MSPISGLIFAGVWYVLGVARRTREMLRYRAKLAGAFLVLYAFGVVGFKNAGYSVIEVVAFSCLLALTPSLFMRPPKRSRRIPKHIRKAVVARDLRGEAFNPDMHHIDHIVPFSKGGDHSAENLRVVLKHENLKKGARMPRLWDVVESDVGPSRTVRR